MLATVLSKNAASIGPAGWAAASSTGTGSHGPVASIVRTNAHISAGTGEGNRRDASSSASPSM